MIIAPKETPTILDTNIAQVEAGIDVWDSTVSYAVGSIVQINGTTNRIYKATVENTGVNPATDVNVITGVGSSWVDYGATNYYRAFDELSSSKCSNATQIYYKFQTSDIDLLMLSSLSAQSVRVVVTNTASSTVLLDETYDTTKRDVYDWVDWTYAPAEKQSQFFKMLPLAFDTTLEIYINDADIAEVGHIVFGRSKNYGLSLINPSPISSRRSITTKTRDEWGNIITRRKARYRRMNITCSINENAIDIIEDRLDSIVDTPCIFVGDEREDGYKTLLVYGELKDHDIPISAVKTKYQLQIEGYI